MLQYIYATEESTRQLRKRLFLFFTSALFVLALSLTLSIYISLLDQLKKAEYNSISHVAEIRSMAISEWCRRSKDIARQITSRTRMREELEKYNRQIISLDQLTAFTKPKLQDAMHISSEIAGIIRLDAKNRVVAECGYSSIPGLGPSEILHYVFNNTVLSEPIIAGDRSFIIASAPILNRSNERQGTDLVIIDLVSLEKIITNLDQTNKNNESVAGYIHGNNILPLLPHNKRDDLLSRVQDFIRMAIEGKKGLGYVADLVVAYQPIEECDWGLAIVKNEHELYSPVYKKMAIIGCLSLAIYLVILSLFWFLLKPLAGRILMHTDDLEKKIQEKTINLEQEIAARKKTQEEKEKIIAELQEAMAQVKTLRGLLPICARCKKIRDDKGYWNQIEIYIAEHSEATFTHGICPECKKELYPELDND